MEAASQQPKLYSPLDYHKKEIRVLRLDPTPQQDKPIYCKLWTINFQEKKSEFIPLSYVWGDPHATKEIFVNGIPFQATLNLVAFFSHFKFLPKSLQAFPLWVDAICIDQGNLEERHQQIKLMREIYGQTQLTISWLGPASKEERSNFAICWINTIAKHLLKTGPTQSMLDKYASNLVDRRMTVWNAISRLLRRPYWQRVWTLQEVVLPENNLMLCGSQSFELRKISIISGALLFLQGENLTERNQRWQHIAHSSFFEMSSQTFRIDRITRLKTLINHDSNGEDSYHQWVTLFQNSIELDATDPRDHIYGMMSVLPESSLEADYKKSIRELYMEQTIIMITYENMSNQQKAEMLTFVLTVSGHRQDESLSRNIWSLPSWVPDWTRSSCFKRSWLAFNASISDQAIWIPRPITSIKDGVLRLSGVKHSRVKTIRRSRNEDILNFATGILQDAAQIKSCLMDNMTKFQAFLRALVSDWVELSSKRIGKDLKLLLEFACGFLLVLWSCCDSDGKSIYPPDLQGLQSLLRDLDVLSISDWEDLLWGPRISLSYEEARRWTEGLLSEPFPLLHVRQKFNIAKLMWSLLFSNEMYHDEFSPFGLESLSDIVKLSRNAREQLLTERTLLGLGRTMFWTENGYLGSTWDEASSGDYVCIFSGCNVPIILRQDRDHYIHVGTCFVVGLMDGEANQDIENGSLTLEEFNIH